MHLQKRIDAFLEGVASRLGSIDEAEFEGHRAALIAAKLQKDHALGDEADRNWEQISNRRCLALCCVCVACKRGAQRLHAATFPLPEHDATLTCLTVPTHQAKLLLHVYEGEPHRL